MAKFIVVAINEIEADSMEQAVAQAKGVAIPGELGFFAVNANGRCFGGVYSVYVASALTDVMEFVDSE